MEKLDRYNIMRFVYGVYHSHRIRYKDYLQATVQDANYQLWRCLALFCIAKHAS